MSLPYEGGIRLLESRMGEPVDDPDGLRQLAIECMKKLQRMERLVELLEKTADLHEFAAGAMTATGNPRQAEIFLRLCGQMRISLKELREAR